MNKHQLKQLIEALSTPIQSPSEKIVEELKFLNFFLRKIRHFDPELFYQEAEWNNSKTKKLNKDTFIYTESISLLVNTPIYKGYIAEVAWTNPIIKSKLYRIKEAGYYELNNGQYQRI